MNAGDLLGSLIEGALTGRRGRRRSLRRLTGGSGSLLNAQTLIAAAGVAWGLYEAAQAQTPGGSPAASSSGAPPPSAPPPPVPGASASVSPELRQLVRLTLSAARADGDLSLEERGRILERARALGAEDLVTEELSRSYRLDEIVAGVHDQDAAGRLYTLAYEIVRSDDGVTGAERIYLAQLAHRLGLPPEETMRLEQDAEATDPAPVI
jgi:uncharacterized membrane protein YebE (DUF533 family)